MTENWAECVCVCCVFPAPDVVYTIREILIGVEGYDDNVDGSRAKDDGEVIGRGVQSGGHTEICESLAITCESPVRK